MNEAPTDPDVPSEAVAGDARSSAPAASDPPRHQIEALADVYAERHTAMEHYIVSWRVLFALLRVVGIDPRSTTGRIANFVIVLLLLTAMPIGVAAAFGQLEGAPFGTWAVVAACFALISSAVYGPLRAAIGEFLSLHRLMRREQGLRELIAWDERWFTVGKSIPAVSVFAAGMVWLLLRLDSSAETPLPAGTVAVAALLSFEVGEVLYTVVMLGLESRMFARHDYVLYPPSPGETMGLVRSVRGSNRLAMLVGLVATIIIVGFAVLLSDNAEFAGRIAGPLLAIAYLAIGFGVMLPRLATKRIIETDRERRLETMQQRITALMAEHDDPSAEPPAELTRLLEKHETLRASGSSVLPTSSLGSVASSLILPTLTFFLTTAGEEIVRRAIESFAR